MNRVSQLVGVVWLGAAIAICGPQEQPGSATPPKSQPAAKPVPAPVNKGGGAPKKTSLPNPDNPIERLLRMAPEQRELAIEKFPPDQQANFRKQFENFDKQTEAQKQRQLEHLDQFWSLPPDKQKLVRAQMNAFKELPEDRREEVKKAYVTLSSLTPEEREVRLARPQFRNRFTPAELQMLMVLPQYWPAPGVNAGQ
jgi:hypothetical protein